MKLLVRIYEQYQKLSWLSSNMLGATIIIYCAMLLAAAFLILFPGLITDPVMSEIYSHELLDGSFRIFTLGFIISLSSDIIIRN